MASMLRTSILRAAPSVSRRWISSSAVAQKDLIQELYLSQLKAYKAPAVAKDAHLTSVKSFNPPTPPTAPVLPDLASALASFDAAEPVLASAAPKKAAAAEEGAGEGADEYLTFLEKDLPKAEVHH